MSRPPLTTVAGADGPPPLGRNRILTGDALTRLRALPEHSVDCIVTSPPYAALRDYQIAGQLGAVDHVDAWVGQLQAVARELARVLKPSGTLWLNLGDSYSRAPTWGAPTKSLLLGPERLLLALQSDGWVVRNKIVWAKANPTPSSVSDRLTCAWEPVYLLTRSGRYHFDLDAVRVPHRSRLKSRGKPLDRTARRAWTGALAGNQRGLDSLKTKGVVGHPLGKNPADVWTLPTSNFRGGHFATFPERLVEPALLAGCPTWTCTACGLPWRREPVDRQRARQLGRLAVLGELLPTCHCDADRRPGLVLDPFLGAGTVAVVAERLERDWLGIELNPDFVRMSWRRIRARRAENVPDSDGGATPEAHV